jgi:hypothetical protein
MAVSLLSQLIADVSMWRFRVKLRPVCVGFLVKIVVLGLVVSESCNLSLPLLHQCSILVCASVTLAVSSWQMIESLGNTLK